MAKFLTLSGLAAEVAKASNRSISEATLRKLHTRQIIDCVRDSSGRRLFRRDAVAKVVEYLEAQGPSGRPRAVA